MRRTTQQPGEGSEIEIGHLGSEHPPAPPSARWPSPRGLRYTETWRPPPSPPQILRDKNSSHTVLKSQRIDRGRPAMPCPAGPALPGLPCICFASGRMRRSVGMYPVPWDRGAHLSGVGADPAQMTMGRPCRRPFLVGSGSTVIAAVSHRNSSPVAMMWRLIEKTTFGASRFK